MARKTTAKPKPADGVKRGRGRPSGYTQTLADEFCQRIAAGNSMNKVCLAKDMPNASTIFRWLGEHEDFCNQYARSCAERREVRKEQLLDIPERKDLDPQRGRLLSDNIKWVLAKEEPRKYGEKVQQEISGPDGGPIETRYASYDDAALDELIRKKAAEAGLL